MYNGNTRKSALVLIEQGLSLRSISKSTGISRATLRDWRDHPEERNKNRAACPRCADPPSYPEPRPAYAYVLGLYLGDGCITRGGGAREGTPVLRISCADAWPGLLEECKRAVGAVRPGNKVRAVQRVGCTDVVVCSRHWPCLLPQHGPGQKHTRKIELEPWQRLMVADHAGDFVRGLFHSDGCRIVNRVRRPLATGDRWYEYPRYLFSNESGDILEICGEVLDQLGVAWRFSKGNTISIARREAVARLDMFVGPKY